MYNIEIHATFRQIMSVFYQFGIWQDGKESSVREMTWKIFHLFHFILFQIIVVTCGYLSDDENDLLFCVEVEVGTIVLTIKLVYLLWKKDDIQAILSGFLITHSFENHEEYVDITKKINYFMKFVHAYMLGLVATAIILAAATLPIFSSEKTLPIIFTLPFDSERNEIIYWSTYAYLTFELFFLVALSFFPVIIWYIMLNCAIKYQILGNQLRNQRTIVSTSKCPRNIQNLVGLVKMHQNIFETIERIKSFFSYLFLAQVATSGICICISTYALAFNYHERIMESATYVACILYAIFDIFLVMYLGNEIMLSSERLSYCLFESNWMEPMELRSSRKCVVILFEVLKRSQKLLIFKLFPINLETFSSIIQLTYSMFNILKSVNENN